MGLVATLGCHAVFDPDEYIFDGATVPDTGSGDAGPTDDAGPLNSCENLMPVEGTQCCTDEDFDCDDIEGVEAFCVDDDCENGVAGICIPFREEQRAGMPCAEDDDCLSLDCSANQDRLFLCGMPQPNGVCRAANSLPCCQQDADCDQLIERCRPSSDGPGTCLRIGTIDDNCFDDTDCVGTCETRTPLNCFSGRITPGTCRS